MKQIFFIFFVLGSIASNLLGQRAQYRQYNGVVNGNYQYGPATDFPNNLVADDFGPRQKDASTLYDWHGGIDYNSPGGMDSDDNSDLILSIEPGIVDPSSNVNSSGFKWVSIRGTHNIVYEHIGTNALLGSIGSQGIVMEGCIIKHLEVDSSITATLSPTNPLNWAIIFQIDTVYTAIGPINNSRVKLVTGSQSRILTVTNSVAAGDPVAPLGSSGTHYAPHAHIQAMSALTNGNGATIPVGNSVGDKYAKNPLEFITHTSPDSLKIKIIQQGIANAVSPVYSTDGNTRTPLSAQVLLRDTTETKRYKDYVVDFERVEFRLARAGSNIWRNIQGKSASNKIQFGGRGSDPVLPANMRTQGVGSWGLTGMKPRIYWNKPYEEFYYQDFYVRIHRSDSTLMAQHPWHARYIDGNYQMKAAITNVNKPFPTNWSQPYSFAIDNFNPFVLGANVYFSNGPQGQPVYSRFWDEGSKGAINLGVRSSKSVPDPNNPGSMTVYGLFSERMSSVKARVPNLFDWINGNKISITAVGQEQWEFSFGTSNSIVEATCYSIEFDGYDYAGNRILDLSIPALCENNTLKVTLPVRNGPNSWANPHAQGTDRVHFFKLGPCGESSGPNTPCLTYEDVITQVVYASQGNSDGKINLTINGDHPNSTFEWSKNNVVISTSQNLVNVPKGEYCLKIKDGCCTVAGCFEIGECNIQYTSSYNHPTTSSPSSGNIDITMVDGNDPFTYLWSNGTTGRYLHDIPNGQYCVTITDRYGCQASTCVTLVTCAPIDPGAAMNIQQPTSCNTNDGTIRILTTNPTGGTAPYTLGLYDPEGHLLTLPPNAQTYTGLAPGTYCFKATDSNGCTGEQCVELGTNLLVPVLETGVSPSCQGVAKGVVGVIASTVSDFVWSNGVTTASAVESTMENLPAGVYCVTVTSTTTGCSTNTCLSVVGLEATSPLSVTAFTKEPCPTRNDGYIDLTVQGGVAPYTYHWEGTKISDWYQEDIYNLPDKGLFSVTVTDFCGSTQVSNFQFQPFDLELTATPGCEGQGTISAEVTGDAALPFSWWWGTSIPNLNETNTPTITELRSREYRLDFHDGNGCRLIKYIDLVNANVYATTEPTCDLLHEGKIVYHVSNPNEEGVLITLNGNLVYSNSSAPEEFTVEVGELPAGEYSSLVTMGNCFQNEVIESKVLDQPSSTGFVSYDNNDKLCKYQNYCHGVLIPNSFSFENPITLFYDVDHGLLKCKSKIKCGGEEVGDLEKENVTLRVGQYKTLLNSLVHIGSDVAQVYLDQLSDEDNCEWVKFCPIDMHIISTGEDFGIEPPPMAPIPNQPGCYSLTCGPLGTNNENFCTNELYAGLGIPNGEMVSGCNPMTATLAELVTWQSHLATMYPETYPTSALAIWIADNEESPVAGCARVRFCFSDFTIIELPNLDEIPSCEDHHFIFTIPADDSGDTQWEWNGEPIQPLPTVPLPLQIDGCNLYQ